MERYSGEAMHPACPNLVFVAGPDGAGKSTVAAFLIANRSLRQFMNADVIAHGMTHTHAARDSDMRAGRIVLSQLHEAITNGRDVAFESTMAGRTWVSLIRKAKERGSEITICYVALHSPELAQSRVSYRVAEGGHDIPGATVARRFRRSLQMFFSTYSKLCDNWYFFDNSGDRALLVALREGHGTQVVRERAIFDRYQRS